LGSKLVKGNYPKSGKCRVSLKKQKKNEPRKSGEDQS